MLNSIHEEKISILVGSAGTGKTTTLLGELPKDSKNVIFDPYHRYKINIKVEDLQKANTYLKQYAQILLLDNYNIKLVLNEQKEIVIDVDGTSHSIKKIAIFLAKLIEAKLVNLDYFIIKDFFSVLDNHTSTLILQLLIEVKPCKIIIVTKNHNFMKLVPVEDLEEFNTSSFQANLKSRINPNNFISPEDKISTLFSGSSTHYTNNLLKIACAIMTRELAKKTLIYKNTKITEGTEESIDKIIEEFYRTYSNNFFHYSENFNIDFLKQALQRFSVSYAKETNLEKLLEQDVITERDFYKFIQKELKNHIFYSKFFEILEMRVLSEEMLFKTAKTYKPDLKVLPKSYGLRIRAYLDVIKEHIEISNEDFFDFRAKMQLVSVVVHGADDWKGLVSIKEEDIKSIKQTLQNMADKINFKI